MHHSSNDREDKDTSPCAGPRRTPALTRREALLTGALVLPPLLAGSKAEAAENFALPGPFRGRVVEVFHSHVLAQNRIVRGALREMVAQAMMRMTGERSETGAWRRFFGPEDVVGIKGSAVGLPNAIAHPETLLEVIRGLQLAGVRPANILVFERYDADLRQGGYLQVLPPGVRCASGSPESTEIQLQTQGVPGTNILGYDEKTYVEFPRLGPGADPQNPAHRRSHLQWAVSREVTKVVNLCALKDHAAAGLTLSLKNMSHGFVNNVWRSHVDPNDPWTDVFIPGVVGLPAIRQKVVLHFCDALWGVYDGGPGRWNPHFRTWPHGSLLCATDPVALDRIGWNILDQKRRAVGLPVLAECGTKRANPGHETFARRQPEHVLRAGEKGLGESRLDHIAHLRVKLSA